MIKLAKCLMTIGLLVSAATASAATSVQIHKMSDKGVESYVQTYEKLKGYWYDDVGSNVLRIRFTGKKKEQSWGKAFRQQIYYYRVKLWGPYSHPEDVGISRSLQTSSEIKSAIEASLSYAEIRDMDRFTNALYYKAGRAKAGRNYIQFYEGGDGNTFGECNWMMIMDYAHKEAVYMAGCYAE